MINYLFFDLDGTLADSQAGVLSAFHVAFEKMGLSVPPLEVLQTYIGPPLETTMAKYWSDSVACQQAIQYFRAYYRQHGVYACQVYEGIVELLAGLKAQGYQLYVTTSKNQAMAEEMVNHLGLAMYFDGIFGAGPGLHEKAQVLNQAMRFAEAPQVASAIVGDTHFDMLGGQACGIMSLGVSWGYGQPQELWATGAAQVFERPQELLTFLTPASL